MTKMKLLANLELVSQAMNKTRDVDHVIENVLDVVFSIFGCDRAWLFHPCDPGTATIRVLAEKNKPEYPGAFTSGQEIPIDIGAAETIRKALMSGSPVVFGPESENKIDEVSARFSVLSQMMMAIHPKTGKPWMFGMHQCSYPRVWTSYEQMLFKEISHRVVEGLNNLILLRDLKRSEQKYRRFFTTVKNGWAFHKTIVNAEGLPVDYVFWEVNEAFEELAGMTNKRIVGKSVSEVFAHDKDTVAFWIDRFEKVSLTGESTSFEGYLRLTQRWYSVSASRPEKGYLITVFEDISKRKEAEKTLRESEERYAMALRAANVGTWDWDVLTGDLKWSDRIEPMFGFARGRFGGTYEDFLKCVHPEDRQYVIDSVNEALYKKEEYDIEHRIVWPDKSVHWVLEKGNVFRDKNEEPLRMLGVVQDITEKKESFERFRTILDSIDSIVYVADMETYEVLFLNKSGRDLFGDIIGQTCWQNLQSGRTGPCDFCTNGKLLDDESNPIGQYIWEFRNTVTNEWYECRDQAIRWLDGRIVRMEIASNITQRKEAETRRLELEEKLRQAQKMEAIGTLAGGIAHDFNNILSAVIGYAELAKERSVHIPTVDKDLDEVIKAGTRAKELVKQILAFSRQADVKRVPLQLGDVVQEAIKILRPSLPTTIDITLNLDIGIRPVLANPTQIHQILMNLGTNAFHAMEHSGGKLEISLKEVCLNSADLNKEPDTQAGEFVQLSVRDSGTGIAPEIKNKIFDPFFTTKGADKGTGMGLSVAHGIVKSHGGVIFIDTEVGKGTTVKVFFPVVNMKLGSEKDEAEPIPGGRERILFIDDEEMLTRLNNILLRELGYDVTISSSSREALQIFQRQPDQFDLIITDQTMPGMTGVELAVRMLEIRPDVPIILCTGYSSMISEDTVKSVGIRYLAEKPLGKRQLAVQIRKVLDEYPLSSDM